MRPQAWRMMGPDEMFARSFERFFLFVGRHGDCRVHRAPDHFDGRPYSPQEFYEFAAPYSSRPWDFYHVPDAVAGVREDESSAKPFRRLHFPTPYPSGYRENDDVPFKWFEGNPRSRAVALLAPGWPRADQRIEEKVAAEIARAGVDVALLTLPFHQVRTPRGSYSGEYFISSNVLWTAENIRQCVAEMRIVVRWMRERYEYVGLMGMSVGGLLAGLASACDDVDFYVPVLSACDLGELMWASSITKVIRGELEAAGIDAAALGKAWSICDLEALAVPTRARYCKQFLSRYDGIIPRDFQLKLWETLGRPERRDLPTSHYSVIFELSSVARDIAAFVERCVPLTKTAYSTPPLEVRG